MGKRLIGGNTKDINDMRVLVTGGAGFIGSHLVDKLIDEGARVSVLDNLSYGKRENLNAAVEFIEADILEYDRMKDAVADKDMVFHLAACATTNESSMGWNDPLADYQVNAVGTLNALRAITETSRKAKMIYASSAAVYGNPQFTPITEEHPNNPVSPYGISKLAGEKYCYAYMVEQGVDSVVMRIFNTYGPRQPRYVMFDLMKKLSEDPTRLEVLGTGQQVRDYCYVSDTVDALILAAQKGHSGDIFNIAGGKAITISDLAEQLVRISGLSDRTSIHFTDKSWKGDIDILMSDTTRINQSLGFIPEVSLEEGMQKLRDWFLEYKQKSGVG